MPDAAIEMPDAALPPVVVPDGSVDVDAGVVRGKWTTGDLHLHTGALIGGLQAGAVWAFSSRMPAPLTAALVLVLSALLTGAPHLDGLADMADGFGGGRTREDVLRIMRDHAIGAYGAVALILLLAVRAAALTALIGAHHAEPTLIIAASLARWTAVPLGRFLPYARGRDPNSDSAQPGGLGAALTDHVGPTELLGATFFAGAVAIGLGGTQGAIAWGAVALFTFGLGRECANRIGGVTGDTMGACTELCEALVYVVAVAIG